MFPVQYPTESKTKACQAIVSGPLFGPPIAKTSLNPRSHGKVVAGEVVCGLLKHDWQATKWGISGAVAGGL
jgi:hypothetical protein